MNKDRFLIGIIIFLGSLIAYVNMNTFIEMAMGVGIALIIIAIIQKDV